MMARRNCLGLMAFLVTTFRWVPAFRPGRKHQVMGTLVSSLLPWDCLIPRSAGAGVAHSPLCLPISSALPKCPEPSSKQQQTFAVASIHQYRVPSSATSATFKQLLLPSCLNHSASQFLTNNMLFSGLILPALLAGSIAAHPGIRSEAGLDFCGTPAPTEEQIQASKFLLERERLQVRSASERTLKVDTVFHVVAASESQEDGYVTVSLPELS